MRPARPLRKLFFGALGLLALGLLVLQGWYYAQVLWWVHHNPQSTAFMEAQLARLRRTDPAARLEHQWADYARVSEHLKRAVVAAEDARFIAHEGFDWDGIQRALEANQKKGRLIAGGSTISQQLAKNLFLSSERSWLRKGEEAAITWMLESAMSKRRILELYLNVAEWGEGVFGAEAAARRHFGVGAADLTPRQAAWLAAILPSPRRYLRGWETPYLRRRVDTILARMGAARLP